MRYFIHILLLVCLVGSGSVSAQQYQGPIGGVYGFDDIIGVDGTTVSMFDISNWNSDEPDHLNVTVSTADGTSFTLRTYNVSNDHVAFTGHVHHNTPYDEWNISPERFISTVNDQNNTGFFNVVTPIVFELDWEVDCFRLTTLDLLENGVQPSAWVELRAYDTQGYLIGDLRLTGPQGPSGLDLHWEVMGPGIARVELDGEVSPGQGGFGIEDVGFNTCEQCPSYAEQATWGAVKALYGD